jgi:uncharacterized small protein (DUF1192 family)
MAETNKQKDLLGRLGDAGEEAISRVAGSQTASRLLESVGGARERLDEMQKKLRGLDELEQRVAKLEKQIAEMAKPKRSSSSRSRASSTTRRATPRKKPPSS